MKYQDRSTIDQWTLFDFIAMRVQHYCFRSACVIKQIHLDSMALYLTTQMFNKKVQMAFDTLQVEAVVGLLSFTNMISHRSTGGALSTWRGREREIGESEMNNF